MLALLSDRRFFESGDPSGLESRIDWVRFERLLCRHRVLLPAYRALRVSPLWDLVDAPVKEKIVEGVRSMSLQQMAMTAELVAVVAALEEASIPYLCLKGPVLGQLVYGDPIARQFNDLDLYVRREHLENSVSLLRAKGYRIVDESAWKLATSGSAVPQSLYHLHLRRGSFSLELHWRLSRNDELIPFSDDDLWSGLRFVNISGKRLATLGQREILAYLDVHGASHCWNRLKWLIDTSVLSRSIKNPYCCLATQIRERLVDLCQLNAKDGAAEVVEMKAARLIERFCVQQMTTEVEDPSGIMNTARRSFIVCSLFEQSRQKLGYSLQLLLWPGSFDIVRLPTQARGLYYLLGPILWFWERFLLRH